MLRFDVALLYFFIAFKPATAVTITNTDYSGIQTGSPFTITWTDASTLVTILLKTGNSTNVNDLKVAAIWGTCFIQALRSKEVVLIKCLQLISRGRPLSGLQHRSSKRVYIDLNSRTPQLSQTSRRSSCSPILTGLPYQALPLKRTSSSQVHRQQHH
jgi:hypothetical protein